MSGRRWTETEVERLVSMAQSGESACETAKAIGRSIFAVRQKAQSLSVSFLRQNRWTPEEDSKLWALAGKTTQDEAALVMDRTPGAVGARSQQIGIVWGSNWIRYSRALTVLGIGQLPFRRACDACGIPKRQRSVVKENELCEIARWLLFDAPPCTQEKLLVKSNVLARISKGDFTDAELELLYAPWRRSERRKGGLEADWYRRKHGRPYDNQNEQKEGAR